MKIWWFERCSLIHDGWSLEMTTRGDNSRKAYLKKNSHIIALELDYDKLTIQLFRDGKLRKTIT